MSLGCNTKGLSGPLFKGNNSHGAMCTSRKALFARTSLQCSTDVKRTRA